MENGLEAQLAGPSEAQYGNGKSHSHPSNYPIATIPAPQPPELPLANTHIKSEKPPTAQVAQPPWLILQFSWVLGSIMMQNASSLFLRETSAQSHLWKIVLL